MKKNTSQNRIKTVFINGTSSFGKIRRNNITCSSQKIISTKISHVIPRYNWTSGQTYSEYDDQDDALTTKQFYVYTEDDLSVWKCIKAGAGASVVRPSTASTSIGDVLALSIALG